MKIIAISGKAMHGKDTVAQILNDYLIKQNQKVVIIHYADLLKYICKTYFGWDGKKDDKGRTILQHVGTEVVREQNPTFWVDFVINLLKMFQNEWDYVIIPDCRFPNEIEQVKKAGLLINHLRVVRNNFNSPLTEEQQNHPSEIALDKVQPNAWIYNDGDLDELEDKVVDVLDYLDWEDEKYYLKYDENGGCAGCLCSKCLNEEKCPVFKNTRVCANCIIDACIIECVKFDKRYS